MKRTGSLALAASVALLGAALGQEQAPPGNPAPAEGKTAILQSLFEPQDEATLQESIKLARANGISEQAILEARFVHLVDQGNHAAVGALGPELEAFAPKFKVTDSAIFGAKEEFLAIVEYAHALQALENNDHAAFKEHIKEAFWLSPNQASAFSPHIEQIRLKEAMANLKVDFQRSLSTQEGNKPLTLAKASGDASHVLLHFWSPWSNDCIASIGDFIATSNELSKNGISVISILAETTPDAAPEAAEFRNNAKDLAACQWLLDNPDQPLALDFRLSNLPTVVLIHKDGNVLFNGHPADEELWIQLKKASPKIKRPEIEPAPNDNATP